MAKPKLVASTEIKTADSDGWDWTYFARPNGAPIMDGTHIAETMAHSAGHSGKAELWGVTLHGSNTVVCYTGNGPNSSKHARLIAGIPAYREAFERIANIGSGAAQQQALDVLRWMDAEPKDGHAIKPRSDARPKQADNE